MKYLPSKLSEKEQKWATEIGITAGGYELGSNSSDGVTTNGGTLDGHYEGTETDIIIPSSVESIGVGVFVNCSLLTSVTIPSSVTSIGEAAFHGCTSLTSMTIPSSVTSIGEGAFSSCTSLTSVTIPSSVTSISEGTFSNCSSLTNITIPSSVTSIGEGAFYGCSKLTNITLEKDSPLDPANAAGWGVDTTKCTVTKES